MKQILRCNIIECNQGNAQIVFYKQLWCNHNEVTGMCEEYLYNEDNIEDNKTLVNVCTYKIPTEYTELF